MERFKVSYLGTDPGIRCDPGVAPWPNKSCNKKSYITKLLKESQTKLLCYLVQFDNTTVELRLTDTPHDVIGHRIIHSIIL